MWFWVVLFVVDLLVPLTMAGFGLYFKKNAPRNINSTFGYRTVRSMKNLDTWRFAHRHFGGLWAKYGLIALPLSAAPLLFLINASEEAIGVVGAIVAILQFIPLVASIVSTEKALIYTFDEEGNRRKK